MGLFSKRPRLDKYDIERLLECGFSETGNRRSPVRYTNDKNDHPSIRNMPHFLKCCFRDCHELNRLLYGCGEYETVTIHTGAFNNCEKLEMVEIRSFSGGIVIEDGAFCNCPCLERVYISYQLINPTIGNEPFINCPNARIIYGSASTYTHG